MDDVSSCILSIVSKIPLIPDRADPMSALDRSAMDVRKVKISVSFLNFILKSNKLSCKNV